MQAIILAGGFGTRLKSVVADVPKPLAPILGRPFIFWLLEYMYGQGIHEAVLCLHHMPEMFQEKLGDNFAGIKLHYSIEEKPLGTGGAIKKAMRELNPLNPVFALNGDSVVDLNYRRMMMHHISSRRPVTIATRQVANCQRYSELTIENGLIKNYELYGNENPGEISTGFYILSPDLFHDTIENKSVTHSFPGLAEEGGFSIERDLFAPHASQLQPAVYSDVKYFIDIGVPEDYARAQKEIPARLGAELAA